MKRNRRPRNPSATIAALTAALGLLSITSVHAASQIISANPHAVTCNVMVPPQVGVASNTEIQANAYHTTNPDPTCTVTTVINSAFPSYGKPKIVSSDGGVWTNTNARAWINLIKNAGAHYEHYERYFDCGACQACPCPSTHCPQRGDRINDVNDFPGDRPDPEVDSTQLRRDLGAAATRLLPNGLLTQVADKFHWTGSSAPITLMGYSWMGALAGNNFDDIDGYLNVLQADGINLTRVFAIEQWTGLATDGCNVPNSGNSRTPFVGVTSIRPGFPLTIQWKLREMNSAFFTRAQEFVQAAADRGIVVQFSLFEHVGLEKSNSYGQSLGSPYNRLNNDNGYLDYPAVAPNGSALPDFVDTSKADPRDANRDYITEVVRRLGAYDNVIFEIMNEPKDLRWTNAAVSDWHTWVAAALDTEFMKTQVTAPTPKTQNVVPGGTFFFTVTASSPSSVTYLWQRQAPGSPTFVNLADDGRISGSRTRTLRIAAAGSADAGNYRCLVSGTSGAANSGPGILTVLAGGLAVRDGFGTAVDPLHAKATEGGGKVWAADNVKSADGKAKSRNEPGDSRILAGVPVSLSNLKTAVVEADLRQQSIGVVALGFPASGPIAVFEDLAVPNDNSLWVEFSRAGLLSLRKRANGAVSTITSFDMTAIGYVSGATVNVRLVYKTSPSPRADVYVNGIRRITNANIGFAPNIQFAGFQGRRASSTTPYSDIDGDVDNFVVTLSAQ